MDPKRWKEIERICQSALQIKREKREAYLKEACAKDESLRKEVGALLEQQTKAEGFLQDPAIEDAAKALAKEQEIAVTGELTGRTISHYRVIEKLGAGGMGVVYRAQDVRLGRVVALKFLSGELVKNRQSLERFQREARAVSALNHPNICTLYDIGEYEEQAFLVMEHLAGETLAERLKKGPLPLVQALDLGAQIADALDVAHRQGIVHRDLKPGNVVLTGTGAKLLDFGLAKLQRDPLAVESSAESPASLTENGAILGTVPYMAPEQLEGKPADARTDIWALGLVLYEMVTGKRPFEGPSQASLIAAILEREPAPLAVLQPLTPPLLEHTIKLCLAKSPDARWSSAHDLADQLRWIREGGSPGVSRGTTVQRVRKWRWALAGTIIISALALVGGAMFFQRWRTGNAQPVMRSTITVSTWGLSLRGGGGLAISPDGKTIVFSAEDSNESRLYLRRLGDEWEPRGLMGTQKAGGPFFSYDGEWIAYTIGGEGLFKIPVSGGQPKRICSGGGIYGGAWGRDGRIIFGGWGNPGAGLWSVSAEGGELQRITQPAGESGSIRHIQPHLLPGGDYALFTIWQEGRASIAAVSIRTGRVQPLIDDGSRAHYLPSGHLAYISEGHLFAIAFDPDRLEKRGESRVLIDDIAGGEYLCGYDVSQTGTLAYLSSSPFTGRLVWKDRNGNTVPLRYNSRIYSTPALSPDGRVLAVTVRQDLQRNIWIGSVDGEPLNRLTPGSDDWFSLFSRDGRRLLFTSGQNGKYNIFSTAVDGSAKPERLTDGSHAQRATSFSPQGDVLLYNEMDPKTRLDILQVNLDRPQAARPLVNTPFQEGQAVFSPDGLYFAYASNELGHYEVYVQAYPGPGLKKRVSINGGHAPAWNPKGGELFYQATAGVMAVKVVDGVPIGQPIQLFKHPHWTGVERNWDVSPDGRRFLVIETAEDRKSPSQINLISNWFEELTRLVPTGKK